MNLRTILAAPILVVFTTALSHAQVVYVNQSQTMNPPDGLTFGTAFPTLEEALTNNPFPGNFYTIRIAQGTYKPGPAAPKFPFMTTGGDRHLSFVIPDDVTGIRGGYSGFEGTSPEPTGLPTILSGDIGMGSVDTDNCYHTMVVRRTNTATGDLEIMDLRIRDGYADAADPLTEEGYGGGILVHGSKVRLTRVIVRECHASRGGGGIAVRDGLDDFDRSVGSRFKARQIRVVNNTARIAGGGLYLSSGQVQNISSSLFKGNSGPLFGGGIYVAPNLSDVEIVNSRIHDNSAKNGGGIYDSGFTSGQGGGHRFVNCTIAYNIAVDFGGGLYVVQSTGMLGVTRCIDNTIIFGNIGMGLANGDNLFNQSSIGSVDVIETRYSLFGPSSSSSFPLSATATVIDTTGTSIVPGWANPIARNFRLASGSICIDRGSDGLITRDWSDIDNDNDDSEDNQREFIMSDQALTGPNDDTRQVFVNGAAASTSMPFPGFDEVPIGRICDIGADEHRYVNIQAQEP